MKILLVNSYFALVGGAEKMFYNTYKLLKANGINVHIWTSDFQPYIDKGYKYIEYFTKYNGGTKNYIKNPFKYFYNFTAKNDLEKMISVVSPDIIHIHSLETLTASILDACKNIPIVYTMHGAGGFCPVSTLMFRNQKICNSKCKKNNYLPCIFNKCANNKLEPSLRRSLLYYFNLKKYNRISKFITPSQSLKKAFLEAELEIDENKIKTISNFLTDEELKITPNYSNKGYFLYIGRLSKEKGVHYLLQAMKDLPKEIKLHIVGTGPEEDNLKQYAKENCLDNIEFLGFKTGDYVKNEYQNCIANILPCNWFEIFGMTNIESFINGKPVIASNIGGIPEIVEDNINGLLFEPANVEQLKECILKYWNNPDLAIEHGKNGYQKGITQYSEEKYYNELMKVYEEVLNEYKNK